MFNKYYAEIKKLNNFTKEDILNKTYQKSA